MHAKQQPVASHRRGRRASGALSDRASVLAQLTRGLMLTYAQCKTPPAPPASQPPVANAKPRSASASLDGVPSTKANAKPKRESLKAPQSRVPNTPTSSTSKPTKPSKSSKPTSASSSSSTFQQQQPPPPPHRRVLTQKTKPSGNDGLDNEEQNLIVRVRDVFGGRDALPVQPEFVVLDLLGQGTFGQVFRCQNTTTKELVAIKVIRNHPSYYKQAIVEVQITRLLNASFTHDDAPHFVRMLDTFEFRNHLCIVFELLSINLYELIAENNFNGFPLEVTRGFQQQLLHALVRMDEIGVIHCDLKPENILLVGQDQYLSDVVYHNDPQIYRLVATRAAGIHQSASSSSGKGGRVAPGRTPFIKVVDFGSACMENETVYSYIQSRFYRSPEVLLGIPYTGSIDLWSLGCIAVEMFLGLPLFPGVSEHDQLRLMEATLGELPQELLRQGRNVLKFYNVRTSDNTFVLKTPAEFARDTQSEIQISKKYFKYTKLDDMVHAYPYANHVREPQRRVEKARRDAFLDFVRVLLCVDPRQRWNARDAMRHPFITGEPFGSEKGQQQQQQKQYAMPRLRLPTPLPLPPRFEYGAQSECGELSATPTSTTSSTAMYSESIWGTSGMPPFAPGIRSHYLQAHNQQQHHDDEPLTPTGGYYSQDSYHYPQQYQQQPSQYQQQQLPQRPQYLGEKAASLSSPSALYIDTPPSSRVYPYDPYRDPQKAYADHHHHHHQPTAYDDAPAYSPFAHYTPTSSHSKVTPSRSRTLTSDGLAPPQYQQYQQQQQQTHQDQAYDSPYYVPPPPPPPPLPFQAVGETQGFYWPWGDAVPITSSLSDNGRSGAGHWPQGRDHVPRHHQYRPEPSSHLNLNPHPQPVRRGKRQHTNSWDSGDTRELRRHEAAYPQNGQAHTQRHTGYAQQHQQQQPRGESTSTSASGSASGRVNSAPRKSHSDHKGRSASGATASRHHPRKSPRGIKPQPPPHHLNLPYSLPPVSQHQSRRHDSAPEPLRSHSHYTRSYASSVAASKRDETAATGVCSVEEKFSSVMSLDLPNAAVPLPT